MKDIQNKSHLLELKDLIPYNGTTIVVNGEIFTLCIESDLSGDWAVWHGRFYSFYATPNYAIKGVPFDIRDLSDLSLDDENYEGSVTDVPTYLQIVEEYIEILLNRQTSQPLCTFDLKPYVGTSIVVNNEIFKLSLEKEQAGDLAVWSGVNHKIFATPNFENEGIAFEFYSTEEEAPADLDTYNGKVTDINTYLKFVKKHIKILIDRNQLSPIERIKTKIEKQISEKNPEEFNDVLQEIKDFIILVGSKDCLSFKNTTAERKFHCPKCNKTTTTMEEIHVGTICFDIGKGYDNIPDYSNTNFNCSRCTNCGAELPERANEYEISD